MSTSNQADVVDMNIIPSNLLQRMDVVTGGASATYGSGAVAGVVNLVLNNRLTGVNLDMDYGVNEARRRQQSARFAISRQTRLFGGKGHLLISVEWQRPGAIRDCAAARDWCAQSRPCSPTRPVAVVARPLHPPSPPYRVRGSASPLPDEQRAIQPVRAQRRHLRE